MPDKTSLLREKLLDLFMDAPVAAAAKSFQELEQSLESDSSVVFILFGDICSIGAIVELVKQRDKVAVVHMDLIDGLAAREAGVDFIKTQTRADGIISTKASLIRYAHQLGLLTIQRYFLLDSRVMENILGSKQHSFADFLEVLPGVMPKIIRQLAQDLLQLIALGGGVIQVIVVAGVIHAVGADHADLVTCGFQHGLDHVGGGGLALGAGHANHRHFQRGTAKIGGGKQRHGVTGVLELDHGHIRQSGQHLGGQVVLDGQHGSAFGGNVRGVIMAVPLGADDADKQTAWRYLAGIIVNVSHFGIQAALNKCIVQIFQQLF